MTGYSLILLNFISALVNFKYYSNHYFVGNLFIGFTNLFTIFLILWSIYSEEKNRGEKNEKK